MMAPIPILKLYNSLLETMLFLSQPKRKSHSNGIERWPTALPDSRVADGPFANAQPAIRTNAVSSSVEGEIIRQDRHEAALRRGSCQLVLRQRRCLPVDDSRCQLLDPCIGHPTDTQIYRMRYGLSRSIVHKCICANHQTSTNGAERCA